MRRVVTIAAGALLLWSCSKMDNQQEGGVLCEASLQVSVEGLCPVDTKSSDEEDYFVTRLDFYEFDENDNLVSHKVREDENGLDLAAIELKYYHFQGKLHTYVVLANLNPTVAEYFAGLNGIELFDPESGIMPLDGFCFDTHRPVMGGGYYCSFVYSSNKMPIILYRYITRFEIGTITADFQDKSLMEKDVRVKRIAFTNVANFVKPLGRQASKIRTNAYQSVFPNGYSYPSNWDTHAFGGVKGSNFRVNDISNNNSSLRVPSNFNGTFCLANYGMEGPMGEELPYIKNLNYKLGASVLNVDVSGAMREAMDVMIDNGQLCPSTAGNKVSVNKDMYLYSMYRDNYIRLYTDDWADQDTVQKMVIEVEIDGQTLFYIVPIRELLPNAIYRIGNITLKGVGSPYSNKCITSATKSASISYDVEISDVEVLTGGFAL